MEKRCTNCAKYPFCEIIDENKITCENICDVWIKRRLNDGNYTSSKFSSREKNR